MPRRTKLLIAAYLIVALTAAWPLTTLIFFHDLQSISLGYQDKAGDARAIRMRRSHLGHSMAVGFLYALIWPVGVPMSFMVTGFAEHGVFSQQ